MVYNPGMRREGDSLRELRRLAAQAEAAVALMYEAGRETAGYAQAKDSFSEAIGMADRLGAAEDAERLRTRLAEVKAVFRGQRFG